MKKANRANDAPRVETTHIVPDKVVVMYKKGDFYHGPLTVESQQVSQF